MVDVNALKEKPTENQSEEKIPELKSSSPLGSSSSKENSLFDICRTGNIKRVEEAILSGMDVNVRGSGIAKTSRD